MRKTLTAAGLTAAALLAGAGAANAADGPALVDAENALQGGVNVPVTVDDSANQVADHAAQNLVAQVGDVVGLDGVEAPDQIEGGAN